MRAPIRSTAINLNDHDALVAVAEDDSDTECLKLLLTGKMSKMFVPTIRKTQYIFKHLLRVF